MCQPKFAIMKIVQTKGILKLHWVGQIRVNLLGVTKGHMSYTVTKLCSKNSDNSSTKIIILYSKFKRLFKHKSIILRFITT